MSSPAASHISIDSDVETIPLYVPPKGKGPAVKQELVIPPIIATSDERTSEFALSPRTTHAALQGHTISQDKLQGVAAGLAVAVRKNQDYERKLQATLADIQAREGRLVEREADAARMEATYQEWRDDRDRQVREDEDSDGCPDDFRKNQGKVPNFFIPITCGSSTLDVLAPFVKLSRGGTSCMGTYGKGKPVFSKELYALPTLPIDEEVECPHWFLEALGDSDVFEDIYKQSLEADNWGLSAEFSRYHSLACDIICAQEESNELRQKLDTLRIQQSQSYRRLLGSGAAKTYAFYRNLEEGPGSSSKTWPRPKNGCCGATCT